MMSFGNSSGSRNRAIQNTCCRASSWTTFESRAGAMARHAKSNANASPASSQRRSAEQWTRNRAFGSAGMETLEEPTGSGSTTSAELMVCRPNVTPLLELPLTPTRWREDPRVWKVRPQPAPGLRAVQRATQVASSSQPAAPTALRVCLAAGRARLPGSPQAVRSSGRADARLGCALPDRHPGHPLLDAQVCSRASVSTSRSATTRISKLSILPRPSSSARVAARRLGSSRSGMVWRMCSGCCCRGMLGRWSVGARRGHQQLRPAERAAGRPSSPARSSRCTARRRPRPGWASLPRGTGPDGRFRIFLDEDQINCAGSQVLRETRATGPPRPRRVRPLAVNSDGTTRLNVGPCC